MPYVTYVAKDREMEPTGFSKLGTDISCAASDDSFNATSTNLSGVLDNQWVKVAGFATATDNGWFQANGNSTSTKISQDTTAALVTEAAGPSVAILGYFRGIGQSYSLGFEATASERAAMFKRERQVPIGGGQPEVLLLRTEKVVAITTGILSEAALGQWREFLASVAAGEVFIFDRYGSIAVPDKPVNAVLESESHAEQRVDFAFNYRIAFSVRLLG